MALETARTTETGITLAIDDTGIATLTIDQVGKKVNVINVDFINELEEVLDALGTDRTGLIVASGKEGQFIAGADLEQILEDESPGRATEMVRHLHRALNRLASLPYPSVALINGPALGGGLEVALACDYRVAVETDSPILGLPEVQLGLLPAGGGTQRLPRLIGLTRALNLILEGKRYTPKRARRYGVVDEVVHPAVLRESAHAWLGKGKRSGLPPWSRLDQLAGRSALVRSVIYRQAARTVAKKTRGHYPAPMRGLDAVRAGQEQGFGAGLAAEAVAFGELAGGAIAHHLIHLFFATEGLKREQRNLAAHALPTDRVGVVGAGFMGAAIAQAAATAGFSVRLRDVQPEQVAHGLKTAHELTRSAARKGRFSRVEAAQIASRLSGTTDYSGFRRAQLVIEAVFEDDAVKRAVIADLEGIVDPRAVIASNTSSLPISSLAADAQHPERIVGMHFFSPVHRMPLLEVIRADRTSEEALVTAIQVGRALGKTIIVVRDGPGFYTTRVLGFMVQEAGKLFEQGASIESIDRAMTACGFPIGPLALTDEVGIDVAAHIAAVLNQAFPERYTPMEAIDRMVRAGRLGRKSKSGFYDYHGKRKKPDDAIYVLRSAGRQEFPREFIQRRLLLAFLNEAARCLAEGIIANPRDGDVGAVMGVGFPPFLGGPFRHADAVGIERVVEQLQQLEYAYGPLYAPAANLVEMASSGRTFYGERIPGLQPS